MKRAIVHLMLIGLLSSSGLTAQEQTIRQRQTQQQFQQLFSIRGVEFTEEQQEEISKLLEKSIDFARI